MAEPMLQDASLWHPCITMIGHRLAHYEITASLGAGGMGEVYKARDTKLKRDVAIKVLPAAFISDENRRARFEREAELLASLNHPNIAQIYGIETLDDVHALIIELVEGPTLADRIAEGPIPADEALTIAGQIADALEAAHGQRTVHRDLKPANIKLRIDGTVKVLDFGIAKALESRATSEPMGPALTSPAETGAGIVLGTAAYMSPEQARGKAVDERTDIWAFGCVLYEMLTGQPTFVGEDRTSTLARVLEREPDTSALPKDLAPSVQHTIRLCLEKDVRKRVADIRDVRLALSGRFDAGAIAAVHGREPSFRKAWPIAAAGLGIAGIALASWLLVQRDNAVLVQATLPPPPSTVLGPTSGFALSPDGSRLAFVAENANGVTRIWVRPLAALEAYELAGTEGAFAPFWSPDGRDIGFFADERLKRVPAAGGAVQTLAQGTVEPKGGAWSVDGRIVYVPDFRTGLFEVFAAGGDARGLTTLDAERGENSHRWPQFLPDGRTLLFLVQTAEAGAPDDQSRIEALTPDGLRHEIIGGNASAVYAPSGHLLFWREGSIYAQVLDTEALRLSGEPTPVARGVGLSVNEWSTFTISDTGVLVYHDASLVRWRLEWRDRTGRLLSVAAPEGEYAEPALARDGRRVAYLEPVTTLRLLDLARGTNTRLSFEDVDHMGPAWSPSDNWLAYSANKPRGPGSEIYRHSSSGGGERELVYSSETGVVRGLSWAPDERSLAFAENGDIFNLDLATRETRVAVDTRGFARLPRFSPDGRWLAYVADDSGRDEVYIVATDGGPARIQVSNEGAREPEWSATGDELFFLALDGSLQAARIGSETDDGIGVPETLFPIGTAGLAHYEVGPDGAILVRAPVASQPHSFTVVLNWPELLD